MRFYYNTVLSDTHTYCHASGAISAVRSDYTPIIEILTFLPHELTKRVHIVINDDTNVEFDERFFLYLVSGEGVHLSPFQRAKVVIRNDDGKHIW